MHIKLVSVTYARKFNLGDYNSLEIAESLWADLEPGEDAATIAPQLHQLARDHVRAQWLRVKKPKDRR